MKKSKSFSLVSPLYKAPRIFSAVIFLLIILVLLGQYLDNRFVNPFMPSFTAFSILCLITPWIAQYIYKTYLSLEDILVSLTETSQRELFAKYEYLLFGINQWSLLAALVIAVFAEITNAIVWGIWFSFAGTTFYIFLVVLFGIFGSLGWVYWGILLFSFRLANLNFDLEPFETKKEEFEKLNSKFLNFFIAGIVLYIGALIAGWLALGQYILIIPALKFWVLPLAIMVILFFIGIQFSLHNIMKKAKNIRLNKIMLQVRRHYREWEQTQSHEKTSLINDLLSWKEKIEKESDLPFDVITTLSLFATIVLPAVKSLIELLR